MSQVNTKTIYGDSYAPTFYRDFASSQDLNAGIGPAITFSRGSHATNINSLGYVVYAPNNVLLNSEATSFATWNIVPTGTLGLTRTLTTGTINGYNYVDVTWFGTATATGTLVQDPNITNANIADLGQTWTFSTLASLTVNSGTVPITQINVGERTSAGVLLAATPTYFSSSTLARYSVTRTLNQSTVARVTGEVRASVNNGSTYNFTVRISQPQLELGVTSPTSYKPTTGTAYYGPRFDYDPNTLQCKGLLFEETRTNQFTYSSQFNDSSWVGTNTTVTADLSTISPDGGTNSFVLTVTANSPGGADLVKNNNPNSTTVTDSIFARRVNNDWLRVFQTGTGCSAWFNLSNGTVGTTLNTSASTVSAAMFKYPNNWYRCTITSMFSATVTSLTMRVVPVIADNSTTQTINGSVNIWGAQREAATFQTSYIPTGTSTVTRNGDSALVTPISSFYNQTEGSVMYEVYRPPIVLSALTNKWSDPMCFYKSDLSNNYIDFYNQIQNTSSFPLAGGSASIKILDNNVNQAETGTSNNNISNGFYKFVAGFKLNDIATFGSNTVGFIDTSATIPSGLDALSIGSFRGTVNFYCGWIRKVAYYPSRLPNSILQYLTK